MSALRSQFVAVITALVALACLTGSSRAFITKVDGSLTDAVVFHFYLSVNDAEPSKIRVVEFVVQEKKSQKEWVTVWELRGAQTLGAITYGSKYNGLSETVPVKPLLRTEKYRVLVSERAWLSPTGYSAVYFMFDQDGRAFATKPGSQ
jgi:hypothetical protein